MVRFFRRGFTLVTGALVVLIALTAASPLDLDNNDLAAVRVVHTGNAASASLPAGLALRTATVSLAIAINLPRRARRNLASEANAPTSVTVTLNDMISNRIAPTASANTFQAPGPVRTTINAPSTRASNASASIPLARPTATTSDTRAPTTCSDDAQCVSGRCLEDNYVSYHDDNGIPTGVSVVTYTTICDYLNNGQPGCRTYRDCATGLCKDGTCAAGTDGDHCVASSQCEDVCSSEGLCETPASNSLASGQLCSEDDQCITKACNSYKYVSRPTLDDPSVSVAEQDKVCGQSNDGGACLTQSDCQTGACLSTKDSSSSGKTCQLQDLGGQCSADSQCTTGACDPKTGTCGKVGAYGGCSSDSDCYSGSCEEGPCEYYNCRPVHICAAVPTNGQCRGDIDCEGGETCDDTTSTCLVRDNFTCREDGQCQSGYCMPLNNPYFSNDGQCAPKPSTAQSSTITITPASTTAAITITTTNTTNTATAPTTSTTSSTSPTTTASSTDLTTNTTTSTTETLPKSATKTETGPAASKNNSNLDDPSQEHRYFTQHGPTSPSSSLGQPSPSFPPRQRNTETSPACTSSVFLSQKRQAVGAGGADDADDDYAVETLHTLSELLEEAEEAANESDTVQTIRICNATVMFKDGDALGALETLAPASAQQKIENVALRVYILLSVRRSDLAQREYEAARSWADNSLLI
ncbi:hypothetical protein OC845_005973 [Tilletia horrida]|nr:hypothetical protein OC845_005973 [Tilletia horrida]